METKEHQIHDERAVVTSLDRRRLIELAGAIRHHEARVRGQVASPRPHDLELYRRLRQIGGAL